MSDTNVTDIKEAADAELEARLEEGRAKARFLSQMILGEVVQISAEVEIEAVPGGWLYWRKHKAGVSGVFVPKPKVIEEKPRIIT